MRRLDGHSGYRMIEEYFAVDSMDELNALHAEKKKLVCRSVYGRFHLSEIEKIKCGGHTMDFDGIRETGKTFYGVGFTLEEQTSYGFRYTCYLVLGDKTK